MNPVYTHLEESVAGDLYQILHRIDRTPIREPFVACACASGQDPDCTAIRHPILSRWDNVGEEEWDSRLMYADTFGRLPKTIDYVARTTMSGIVVQFRAGRLHMVPFINQAYANDAFNKWRYLDQFLWSTNDAHIRLMIQDEAKLAGRRVSVRTPIAPVDRWRINGGMFRYDKASSGIVDNILFEQLFGDVARHMVDMDLVVNKRDFPLVRRDWHHHPFEDTFGQDAVYAYPESMVPILSGSCDPIRFSDLLMPHHEDILRAYIQAGHRFIRPDGQDAFPDSRYPKIVKLKTYERERRADRAIFRGSCTGMGTTKETNVRLALCEASLQRPDLLDAKLVKSNPRPRCHVSRPFEIRLPDEDRRYFAAERMSLQEQSNLFKYVVTPPGHVAAYRLSYELSSDLVVILVDSPYKVWYSNMLEPYKHYVPAKDAQDVLGKIEWCRTHKEMCDLIVAEANAFYERYLSKAAIVDYTRYLLARSAPRQQFTFPAANVFAERDASMAAICVPAFVTEHPFSSHIATPEQTFDKLGATARSYGKLRTQQKIFLPANLHSTTDWRDWPELQRPHLKALVYQNSWCFVCKTGRHDLMLQRPRPLEHEVAVGCKAVNVLCRQVPNYMFTFGLRNQQAWLEYIHGMRLRDWIRTPPRSNTILSRPERLAALILQVASAIEYGQQSCGFIHGDLVGRNIVVQALPQDKAFDYPRGDHFLRISTAEVPVMIDFDQSQACIAEGGSSGSSGSSGGILVPLMHWQATRYRDAGYDIATLLLDILDIAGRIPATHQEEPSLSRALSALLAKFVAESLGEVRYNLEDPMQLALFVKRYKNSVARERLDHRLGCRHLIDALLVTFPALQQKVHTIAPAWIEPYGEPSIGIGMDQASTLLLYWTAHFGKENVVAIAEAIVSSLAQKAVPDSDCKWLTKFACLLARHHYRALKHAVQEAHMPNLLDAFERYTAFFQNRRLMETVGESVPMLLEIPKPAYGSLDLWNLPTFSHSMFTGDIDDSPPPIIFGNYAEGLRLMKALRFFAWPKLFEEAGVRVEEVREKIWLRDTFACCIALAGHNWVAVDARDTADIVFSTERE